MRARRPSLNESPSEKEGKSGSSPYPSPTPPSLNESPSEKEGKCHGVRGFNLIRPGASMKALPKRKGNSLVAPRVGALIGMPQ